MKEWIVWGMKDGKRSAVRQRKAAGNAGSTRHARNFQHGMRAHMSPATCSFTWDDHMKVVFSQAERVPGRTKSRARETPTGCYHHACI